MEREAPMKTVTALKFVSTAAMAAALAQPAFAAEQAPEDEQGGAIREIVVTALDQRSLEQATIKDIRDVAGRTPSLVIDSVSAGPSAAAIDIRGISFEDIEKSFDPAVGVSVDGVVIGTN